MIPTWLTDLLFTCPNFFWGLEEEEEDDDARLSVDVAPIHGTDK